MKLTPSRRQCGLGAVVLLALTLCSRKLSKMGEPSFTVSQRTRRQPLGPENPDPGDASFLHPEALTHHLSAKLI